MEVTVSGQVAATIGCADDSEAESPSAPGAQPAAAIRVRAARAVRLVCRCMGRRKAAGVTARNR